MRKNNSYWSGLSKREELLDSKNTETSNHIYFYSDVKHDSCLKLNKTL